jgi:hypothetical protein
VSSPVATGDEEGKAAKRKKIDQERENKKEEKKTQICKPEGVGGLDQRCRRRPRGRANPNRGLDINHRYQTPKGATSALDL